ncbi:MAG: hypothetical protein CMJ62_18565 [Planctomycetaceae bacterium]|nr:hypothetical protein [Planctomycetaceae bacterium]
MKRVCKGTLFADIQVGYRRNVLGHPLLSDQGARADQLLSGRCQKRYRLLMRGHTNHEKYEYTEGIDPRLHKLFPIL